MPSASPTDQTRQPEAVDQSAANAARATRNLRHGLISVAILVAMVAGILLAVPGLHGVASTVAHMRASLILLAILLEVLSCLGYVLIFLRVFDRLPLRFGARVAMSELGFGAAVSLGGAGSIAVGSWLLIDRGIPGSQVAEGSAVLFVLTSVVNVITLALVGVACLTGLVPGPREPILSLVPAALGALVLVLFFALPRITQRLARFRSPGRVRTLLDQTAVTVRETERLLVAPDWRLLGALGYLWLDIGVLVACFAAAGHAPPLASIVLAYQLGYLANVIPVPGNIGVLEASFTGLLVLYGINATDAAAAAIVYHAIALWVPAVWGTLAFLVLRHSRGQPLTLRALPEERRQLRHESHAAWPRPRLLDRGVGYVMALRRQGPSSDQKR